MLDNASIPLKIIDGFIGSLSVFVSWQLFSVKAAVWCTVFEHIFWYILKGKHACHKIKSPEMC